MLKIRVTYFLNDEGKKFFLEWYQRVYMISAQQDGFIKMTVFNNVNPIVELLYESEEKLEKWSHTEEHDELEAAIQPYLLGDVKVEVEEMEEGA